MPSTLKILLVGDPFVGKTSLRAQYIHAVFLSLYRETVGADFLSKQENVRLGNETKEVFLQIWDTAGQERFNLIVKTFYRGTDVAVFVYDVTRPETFNSIFRWMKEVLENCKSSGPAMMVVANKCDRPLLERLISQRQCKEMLCEKFMDQYFVDMDQDVCYVLAKDHEETLLLFERAAFLGLRRLQEQTVVSSFDAVDILDSHPARSSSGCCIIN